nr:J496 [uncultured bacterium]
MHLPSFLDEKVILENFTQLSQGATDRGLCEIEESRSVCDIATPKQLREDR